MTGSTTFCRTETAEIAGALLSAYADRSPSATRAAVLNLASFLTMVANGKPGTLTLVVDIEEDEADDSYPGPCSDPAGHVWPRVEESERCLCIHCGADGDA